MLQTINERRRTTFVEDLEARYEKEMAEAIDWDNNPVLAFMKEKRMSYFPVNHVCEKCGGMDVSYSVMSSYSPNQQHDEVLTELWMNADSDSAFCEDCDDETSIIERTEMNPWIEVGSLVKGLWRADAGAGIVTERIVEHTDEDGDEFGKYKITFAGDEHTPTRTVIRGSNSIKLMSLPNVDANGVLI